MPWLARRAYDAGMTSFKLGILAAALVAASSTFAQGTVIRDGARIQAILSSVSTTSAESGRMTLSERLASLGVTVKSINMGAFTADDIETSGGRTKKGDVDYMFATTEPSESLKSKCPVITIFNLTKRGKSWLPEDRTSNFYQFNICHAP